MAASTGRRTSISIYDYPEHLNPFYEDDNHNKIRFWTIGRKKPGRSNSFSLSGIRNAMTLRSFRGRKNSVSDPPRSPVSPVELRHPEPVTRNTASLSPPSNQGRYVYGGSTTPIPTQRQNHQATLEKNEISASRTSVESTNPFDGLERPLRASRGPRKKYRAPPPPIPTLLVTSQPDVSPDDTSLCVELKITEEPEESPNDKPENSTGTKSQDPVTDKICNGTVTNERIEIDKIKDNKREKDITTITITMKTKVASETSSKESISEETEKSEKKNIVTASVDEANANVRKKTPETSSKESISEETEKSEKKNIVTTSVDEANTNVRKKTPPPTLPKPIMNPSTPPALPSSPPPHLRTRSKRLFQSPTEAPHENTTDGDVSIQKEPPTPPPSPVLPNHEVQSRMLESDALVHSLKHDSPTERTVDGEIERHRRQLDESESEVKQWLKALEETDTPLNESALSQNKTDAEKTNSFYDNVEDDTNNNKVQDESDPVRTGFVRSISSESNGRHKAEINVILNSPSYKDHQWNPLPKPIRRRFFSSKEPTSTL